MVMADMSPFEDETLAFTREHMPEVEILTPKRTLEQELMRGQVVTPFWYMGDKGKPSFVSRRSCTVNYKIKIVNKLIGRYMWDTIWLGISADELRRVRGDDEKLTKGRMRTNRYPLIELGMTREDCVQYLTVQGYPVPPRSSCDICPFASDLRLLRLLNQNTGTFERIKRIESAWHKRPKNAHKFLTRYLADLPTSEQAAYMLEVKEARLVDNSGTCGVCEF